MVNLRIFVSLYLQWSTTHCVLQYSLSQSGLSIGGLLHPLRVHSGCGGSCAATGGDCCVSTNKKGAHWMGERTREKGKRKNKRNIQ